MLDLKQNYTTIVDYPLTRLLLLLFFNKFNDNLIANETVVAKEKISKLSELRDRTEQMSFHFCRCSLQISKTM